MDFFCSLVQLVHNLLLPDMLNVGFKSCQKLLGPLKNSNSKSVDTLLFFHDSRLVRPSSSANSFKMGKGLMTDAGIEWKMSTRYILMKQPTILEVLGEILQFFIVMIIEIKGNVNHEKSQY